MPNPKPPADLRAEKAVIGSLLIDGERLAEVADELGLAPADFSNPALRSIYEAILAVRDAGRVVDVVTVYGELDDRGAMKRIGEANVTGLINQCPVSTHAGFYARRVLDKAEERRGNQPFKGAVRV